MSSEEFSPGKVRKKQILFAVVGIAVAMVLAYLWVDSGNPGQTGAPPAPPKKVNVTAPGSQIDDREAWRAQADATMRDMQHRLAVLSEKAEKNPGAAVMPPPMLPVIPADPVKIVNQEPSLDQTAANQQAEAARRAELVRQNGQQGSPLPPPPPPPSSTPMHGQQPPPPVQPVQRGIVTVAVKKPENIGQMQKNPSAPGAERKNVSSFLPAGSFVRAVLLMGIDAPTGGQAQTNSQPVLMRVTDNAVLPNRFRYEAKECFIIGSGFGDSSSERAYIRLETLSCVMKDGAALEMPLKGHVAGEDGKVGMRGRLVSKQGQVLANALLAGVASGIGAAFQQSATTQSVSPLGMTNSVAPDKAFQSGFGTGVGGAMNRLAQYYIQVAEKMFPVIEIDAGRLVEVVITKGVDLPAPGSDESDSTFAEIGKRNQRVSRNEDF
jgi:conjugal transfer pilus assembly protein TraB